MTGYEYRVIPAPAKGQKAKGVKTPEERFAHTLEELMNEMGAEGWEYQRADTLPSTERAGLTGTATHWRHVLVFRRALGESAEDTEPEADFTLPPLGTDTETPAPGPVAPRPPQDGPPPRPTLVASRKNPTDSGV